MKNRLRPGVESLDCRTLPAAGVTAVLSQGVLTVVRSDSSQALTIDVQTVPRNAHAYAGVKGQVVVEGVGVYAARHVKMIDVDPGTSPQGVTVNQSSSAPIAVHLLEPLTSSPTPAPAVTAAPTPIAAPQPAAAAPTSAVEVLTPDETGSLSAIGQQIVAITNVDRAAAGLPALTINSDLVLSAQIHAHDMAQLDEMEHTLPGVPLSTLQERASYVGYHYAWLGENIAEGFTDAVSVMNGWMNSPGHRANILETNFTEIGVGISASTPRGTALLRASILVRSSKRGTSVGSIHFIGFRFKQRRLRSNLKVAKGHRTGVGHVVRFRQMFQTKFGLDRVLHLRLGTPCRSPSNSS